MQQRRGSDFFSSKLFCLAAEKYRYGASHREFFFISQKKIQVPDLSNENVRMIA
jgi:hypothetical protein